jgi:guanosine-3',5'-bis(diphosphate) 3'-pyrophosphohydrolase
MCNASALQLIDESVMSEMEQRAALFANHWHAGVTRNFTGEAYITHPAGVVALLREFTYDPVTLAAAWMHDVIEDTTCKATDMEAEFGAEVTDLVLEVTNVSRKSDGPRAVRRAIDRAHVAKASRRGKTLKLADIHHNVSDCTKAPRDFGALYVPEKKLMLEVLREGDLRLFKKVEELLIRAHEALGLEAAAA